MAKALIDNITINLCFNKFFYKQILEEDIAFEDLVFIDRPVRIINKLHQVISFLKRTKKKSKR